MKKITIIALISAAVWITARIILGYSVSPDKANVAGVLSNLFFILILIFTALVLKYRIHNAASGGFFSDLKDAMKPAVIYIVLVVGYMTLHYGWLTSEMTDRRNAVIQNVMSQIDTDEELAIYRNQIHNQEITREEIQKAETEKAEMFLSLKMYIPMSLLILTLMALVYSLLGVVLWRKFLRPV